MSERLNDSAGALTAVLLEEQRHYGTLLDLASEEEEALVGGDVEALTAITEQKEHLRELIGALETERMTALVAIADSTRSELDSLTLTAVIALLPAPQGQALTAAGVALRAQAIALKDANERNAVLLRSSADIVERWI